MHPKSDLTEVRTRDFWIMTEYVMFLRCCRPHNHQGLAREDSTFCLQKLPAPKYALKRLILSNTSGMFSTHHKMEMFVFHFLLYYL